MVPGAITNDQSRCKVGANKYYVFFFSFHGIETLTFYGLSWLHRIPEVIFWHIPSKAYKMVAPMPIFGIHKPCVGSINKERVASQEAEWGTMDILVHRPSVKVGKNWFPTFTRAYACILSIMYTG